MRRQSGLAFIWILLLLVIISALGLTFLQRVSLGTAATATRLTGMKAQYLAEAAANHALWRLQNDPSFSPSQTDYYMHNLGDGRYGYKVRQPTLTKFGTVATVGGVSNVVTNQSYVQYLKPYDIIITYNKWSEGIPKQRRLLGATWSDPSDTVNDGPDSANWVVLRGCPKRKEMIMGTIDWAQHINFAVWNGTTWGNVKELTNDAGSAQYRCFDIAYENLSGDALVVGRINDAESPRYNIWNGSNWAFPSAQTDANLTTDSTVSYLTMASKPNSDEILMAVVRNNNDLNVIQWNGSAFTDRGKIDNDMETDRYGAAAIAYEQQSGDALVLWNHKDRSSIYYSVWSGTSLSPVAQTPGFGGDIHVIRAAADPKSNHIFVAAVDENNDLNVAVWNGDAWIGPYEIETSMDNHDDQLFDVAWEQSGDEVVVAWGSSSGGANIRYYTWRKGTALNTNPVQTGPSSPSTISWVRLYPISGTEKINLLLKNTGGYLRYSLWTGNAFLGNPGTLLSSDLSFRQMNFAIAESGVTYTGRSN